MQIAALRKALGTTPDGQSWILTLPREGYRLLVGSATAAHAAPPVLAVLPFRAVGGEAEADYFADGVTEDIITALAASARSPCSPPAPRSRTATGPDDPRALAAELAVRYLLMGSVRRVGDRLRITAQLVDGDSGGQLWAEHFDGALGDVFEFQDRITADVAMVVEPRIQIAEIERSRRERPGSVAAYDIYLQALPKIARQTAKENAEAYALLTRALAIEPDNALLLAEAGWALATARDGLAADRPGRRAGLRGLRAPRPAACGGRPVVMAHCGLSLLQTGKEYDFGMAVLDSAARSQPEQPYGGVSRGHCAPALRLGRSCAAYFHRANRLSPNDPSAHASLTGIAHCHMVREEYAEALVWATRSLALNSRSTPPTGC